MYIESRCFFLVYVCIRTCPGLFALTGHIVVVPDGVANAADLFLLGIIRCSLLWMSRRYSLVRHGCVEKVYMVENI